MDLALVAGSHPGVSLVDKVDRLCEVSHWELNHLCRLEVEVLSNLQELDLVVIAQA